MIKLKLNILGQDRILELEKEHYAMNHNIALCLFHTDRTGNRELWSFLTTNTDETLPKNYVAVKDYGEGSGNLDMLIENEIVSEPAYYIHSGYVDIPVCKLLIEELLDKN